MSGIMSMLLGAVSAAVSAADEFFNRVTLLLNTSSTNGAQNNTFLDSSSNNFSITRNGNTTQGTFTPFSQTGWSNFFFGQVGVANGSISATHPAMNATWTIEAWIYRTSGGVNQCITLLNNGGFSGILVYISPSNYLTVNDGVTVVGSFTTVSVPINTWTHIAVVRSGGTTTGYVNGVVAGSNTFTPATVSSIRIGEYYFGDFMFFPGYISNFRVVNGAAVYTSAFTPPTAPLTNITNTSLLTCQSNRFVDNSTANSGSGWPITVNGNASVQAFSPFAPTAAYDAAVVGGSGYFDGTGDYLSVANDALLAAGTGDFTWEAWVYWIGGSGENTIWVTDVTGGMNIGFNIGGTWQIATRGIAAQNNFGAIVKNQWNYLAISRTGTTINAYLNGARVFNGSNSTDYVSGGALGIGAIPTASGNIFLGYISSLRWTKGSALYTGTTMTVPALPSTTTSNGASSTTVELLTNFTNAGIYDAAAKNVLETVGNAQVSTTQAKFGTTSMYFDGTGDYLKAPYSKNYALSGDFTIEFWLYYTAHGNYTGIVCCVNDNTSVGPTAGWILSFFSTTDKLTFQAPSVDIITTNTIPSSQWVHIAVVRSGSTITHYTNGVANGSGTSSATFDSSSFPLYVAAARDLATFATCYIDDLRVTKYARYTANFTPATAAFPTQ